MDKIDDDDDGDVAGDSEMKMNFKRKLKMHFNASFILIYFNSQETPRYFFRLKIHLIFYFNPSSLNLLHIFYLI